MPESYNIPGLKALASSDGCNHGWLQEDTMKTVEALVTQLSPVVYHVSETVWQRIVPAEGTRQSPIHEEEHH
jgi:hypothetical protein